jgi:HK97 family phage major capsid protein
MANIKQMEADLRALAKDLEVGQKEMAAGPIPQSRGEELEAKAQEMESLQNHIKQYHRIAGITESARRVESPTMPADNRSDRPKTLHTTPGHLFVASDAFRAYKATGKQGWSSKVPVHSLRGGTVKLSGKDAEAFEAKAFDPATLSDLGEEAMIQPQRDPDVVRYEEAELLTIRDLLNVAPTTSDAIRFVRHTATNRAAASQGGRGAIKQYLTIEADTATVSVETIAVLSKVTEQDIDDAPRLINMINGEMRLDVKVEEERQVVWAEGDNNELDGIFSQGVEDYEFDRAVAGDTLIDTIRRMRTDLRKRRIVPNGVMIDPLDWEQIELEKGTDDRYVWGLIQDLRGPRIWSLRVVESDAMEHPTNGSRRILMGDFQRGATLYDRHDVRMAIGFVDDDFARNLRTLRAEERVALAVKRPFAFSWTESAEAGGGGT